ncbi:MAG: beta-ketoacyl synthase N-terminal-like domain-containing protein [bacterium]
MPGKQNKTDKELHSRLREIPIAIIGMSAIFPQSKNMHAFWDNIVKEINCITEVPPSRWNIEDYYDPDPKAEDKTYCKRGGFIPNIDFDPMEFGLPPNILEVTDVHQLISLILAKQVMKDGGYDDASNAVRKNTGVILGVGGGQKLMIPLISRLQYPIWEKVLKSSGVSDEDTRIIVEKIKKAYVGWEENSFPGALGNIVAGRIANRLNLGGTNCVVDAACASSFSGIRMAISELLDYRADMMISGGVDTDNSPYMFLCFSKTQAFSAGENSQPFDINSSGMIMGEGIGMVLLKRLVDAERDNDRIYAVIKGNGSSSDGRFKSIYAPNAEGQILALERAYKDAAIEPATIDLLEAHGTGTAAGDLAEVSALKGFFEGRDTRKNRIALGSVKSQIGHTKNAAGSAGIIKTSLALYHKILPATINITEPNKDFNLESSPFYFNTTVRPWIHPDSSPPRRAAISAFGFGGTNFHFILEEYERKATGKYRMHLVPQPFLFSATTAGELLSVCETALEELETDQTEQTFYRFSDSSRTIQPAEDYARIGFVADSAAEAAELLKRGIETLREKGEDEFWDLPQGVFFRKTGIDPKGKVVALFAGQGSPYIDMGKELVYNFPPLMESQIAMDELFIEEGLNPLSDIIYPPPSFDKNEKKEQASRLQLTENAQPAIGVFSAGQMQILSQAGLKPDFVAGHSFGELTALWAANVLTTKDYFKLAKARGKAMAAPDDPNFDAGSMLAVMGDVENLETEITDFPEVTIANMNSRNQVVLAGPTNDVIAVQKHLKKLKYRTVLLGVSAAFHTPLVGHAQKPFADAIKAARFSKPQCSVYSNASGKPYSKDPKVIQTTLQDHILNSVRFKDEIANIYKDGGTIFIEFGPQSILSKLVDNILQGKNYISVALNASAKKDSDRQFREAVMRLRVAGLPIGDIDPYQRIPETREIKKTAMTLQLGGMNYVSEKTKKAFEEALNDGHKIQSGIPPVPQPIVSTEIQKPAMTRTETEITITPQTDQRREGSVFAIETLERNLANFHHHQSETLHLHEQFLNSQSEYSRSFFQIMQQQLQAGSTAMSPEVAQSIAQFHKHQGDTLHIHEQYLQQQAAYSQNSFEILRQQQTLVTGSNGQFQPLSSPPPQRPVYHSTVTAAPRPPVTMPTTPPPAPMTEPYIPPVPKPAPSLNTSSPKNTQEALEKALLAVVSEKTGYQSEMLELDMDMEADLGIDSIKRVEILNGIQEKMPDLPSVNPEELSALRTLRQVIDHMSPQKESGSGASSQKEQSVETPSANDVGGMNRDRLVRILLEVVSEKTGYQSEMLELNMDMEADLGIDSIKRVEILNGIQEKLPDLPAVNPEDLSELRTLAQIVAHMVPASQTGNIPSTPSTAIPVAVSGAGIDRSTLSQTLLAVVSEKTGYQSEMLELNMDMEADLGIDSIKRVEILNGIQERLPELPEINPEELSELRTLAQIIDRMTQVTETAAVPASKKKLKN